MSIALYKILNIGLQSDGPKKCKLWLKDTMFTYLQDIFFSHMLIYVSRI